MSLIFLKYLFSVVSDFELLIFKPVGSMNFVSCLARGSVDPCFALFILTVWLALGAVGAWVALLFVIWCIGIQ